MSLDKQALTQAIKQAFEKAKKTEPPADPTPEAIDEVQNKILNQLSLDIADAIDTFVRGGAVKNINVEVRDINNINVIGKGTQIGTGKIE